MFCNAFMETSPRPTSLSYIRQRSGSAVLKYPFGVIGKNSSVNSSAVVTISNLGPDTAYNVYCYTEDYRGNTMELATALSWSVSAQTQCCRRIVLMTNTPVIAKFVPDSAEVQYKFKLNSRPSSGIIAAVSLLPKVCNGSGGTNYTAAAYPKSFSFSPSAVDLTGVFVIRGQPGCYQLKIVASTSYTSAIMNLTIAPDGTPRPPPRMSSVMFSNGGKRIFIEFDTATDLGVKKLAPYGVSFLCSQLLSYPGIGMSMCSWSRNTLLVVTLAYSSDVYVEIGDTMSLQQGILQVACVNGANCSGNPFNTAQMLPINAPVDPIAPLVALSSSGQIVSTCSDISLDPSQSMFKGGAQRPWKTIAWDVSGSGGNVTAIAKHLSNNHASSTFFPAVVDHLWTDIGDLTFQLRLENFLGMVSVASVTIEVVSESVTEANIFGSAVKLMYRWQSLSIYSQVKLTSCGVNVSDEFTSYEYAWTVYDGVQYESSIVSESNDPRTFKLSPYRMLLDHTYTVNVRVSASNTALMPVNYKSTVKILRSYVVATVQGANYFTVTAGSSFTLDGSKSQDMDFPDSTLTTFTWSCREVSPVFGRTCNAQFSSTSVQTINAAGFTGIRFDDAENSEIYVACNWL